MAYNIYTSIPGANIDVDLFARAASAGINAGNAQKTPIQAGVEGLTKGVQLGQEIVQADQLNTLRENQIEQLPVTNALNQTQLANAQSIATINESRARIQSANETLQLEQEAAAYKAQAAESEIKLKDYTSIRRVQDQLVVNPAEAAKQLRDPNVAAALLRDPDQAAQVFAGLEASGVPKDQYAALEKAVNGAAERKLELARQASIIKAKEEASIKEATRTADAIAELSPDLGGRDTKPNFNYNDVDVISNGRLENNGLGSYNILSPDKADKIAGHSLVYRDPETGNIEVVKNYETAEAANAAIANLKQAKAYGPHQNKITATKAPSSPQAGTQPQAQPNAASIDPNEKSAAIAAIVNQRTAQAQATAQAKGAQAEFDRMYSKGKTYVAPVPTKNIVDESQATPVPPSQAALTQKLTPERQALLDSMFATQEFQQMGGELPVPQKGEKPVSFKNVNDERVSAMLGAPAKVNLASNPKTYAEVIEHVRNIPELQGYHPIIKGMVTVESKGNPRAVSPVGAKGLLQIMPEAAVDTKLKDPFDPKQNLAAGAQHLKNRIKEIDKAIIKASAEQGIPIQPDIRFALLAYNGGQKYVLDAIRKGYTTYDEMASYIRKVKKPEAAAENLAYPDKVLAATIQFMEGGNFADDSTMKQLIISGIVDPFMTV